MSNTVFPFLRGLGWPVNHEPLFSTIVNEAASGMESRTALYSRPRKKWTLIFNYLSNNAQSSLAWSQEDMRSLKGFQMARRGKWDSFLFHDVKDSVVQASPALNIVSNGIVGDGSTLTFQLQRAYGDFVEPIYDLNATGVNSVALGSGGSGYTLAAVTFSGGGGQGAAAYAVIAGGAVTGIVLTSSGHSYTSAPTVTINGNGTGATATAQLTPKVYLGGVAQAPSGYSIGATGVVTFVSPPGAGVAVTADLAYYWRVRFGDDSIEYEQFLDCYFRVKKCVLYQTWV